jgi:hypothetical protein
LQQGNATADFVNLDHGYDADVSARLLQFGGFFLGKARGRPRKMRAGKADGPKVRIAATIAAL